MRESTIQKNCLQLAREAGWLAFKFSSPSNRGVPDAILIKSGHVVFVEFKAPGKHPTLLQEHIMQRIRDEDMEVLVIDNVEIFKYALGIR